jgi:hypothetical protein
LFSNVPRWNQPTLAIADGCTKHPLRLKYALRVMSQRAMAKIAKGFLGCIYYLDNHDFTDIALSSNT